MDPTRQLTTPIAEVRAQAPIQIDEYGEAWTVIDGVETKVPSRKMVEQILHQQDDLRMQIREDLDRLGIRDRTEKTTITLEDGTVTEVDMLPPGDQGANILQIGLFDDADDLNAQAMKQQALREEEFQAVLKRIEHNYHSGQPARVKSGFFGQILSIVHSFFPKKVRL